MFDDRVLPDVASLVQRIPDGCMLCVPKDQTGVAMAATRELVRRGIRDLHLVAVPTSGLQAELLIGSGAVATMESAGVTLGEYGQAPAFVRAVKAGAIRLMDSTCPAIHAALRAGEKNIPFIPLRGLIGSDLVRYREDWKVIANPFAVDDPIVALPALRPDVALFHAPLADRHGNVWIGVQRELMTMAHAAHRTLATVEEVVDGNLLDDERLAAGTIPSLYIEAVAEAVQGAWPVGLPGRYGPDGAHLALYAKQAASEDGFRQYLAEQVTGVRAAAE